MTKWEYRTEAAANYFNCQKLLIDAGEEGWELVSVLESRGTYKLFFKRQKQHPIVLND